MASANIGLTLKNDPLQQNKCQKKERKRCEAAKSTSCGDNGKMRNISQLKSLIHHRRLEVTEPCFIGRSFSLSPKHAQTDHISGIWKYAVCHIPYISLGLEDRAHGANQVSLKEHIVGRQRIEIEYYNRGRDRFAESDKQIQSQGLGSWKERSHMIIQIVNWNTIDVRFARWEKKVEQKNCCLEGLLNFVRRKDDVGYLGCRRTLL